MTIVEFDTVARRALRRRDFIAWLGGFAAMLPFAALARPAEQIPDWAPLKGKWDDAIKLRGAHFHYMRRGGHLFAWCSCCNAGEALCDDWNPARRGMPLVVEESDAAIDWPLNRAAR